MWTVFHKQHDILAQCDRISCQSKEGFYMSHDQYLKGDLSLTITDVDYTKRTWYTCECGGVDICAMSLGIEALSSSVWIKSNENLVLDLFISESVKVIYNSTGAAAPSSGQICTVAGSSLQCKDEYTQRASLISAVELRETAPSDSGVYTIWDTSNEEVIHTYTVTVEVQPCPDESSTVTVLAVLLALMGAGLVAAGLVIVQLRKKISSSRKEGIC
ncbi:uncharacterized protein LOC118241332 isoform X2 [Electrophorus electricus]|uniref:uncharacterized protein LOC118241332 isoform X2 n=1 Tax=Electrophorus electricus TaxID=8005 RepID=UPI0015D0B830|nr:uncharacterized protein LOC118241332 isoform X2 [Electrophorus electricus]